MIEPEMPFCDLEDDMNCAEDYVRYCIKHLLENCAEDMEFVNKMIDKNALERCRQVLEKPFKRISYVCCYLSTFFCCECFFFFILFIYLFFFIFFGGSSSDACPCFWVMFHAFLNHVYRYTEAIELLEEHVAKGKKFENPVSWGIDLASEHERYITEEIFKQPTIVYNYPKDIKVYVALVCLFSVFFWREGISC